MRKELTPESLRGTYSSVAWWTLDETMPPDGLEIFFVDKWGKIYIGYHEADYDKFYAWNWTDHIEDVIAWAFPPVFAQFENDSAPRITNDEWMDTFFRIKNRKQDENSEA